MIRSAALASVLALSMTSVSFAQTTGPSGQQDTNKPGMANPDAKSGMSSGSAMQRSNTSGPSSGTTTPGSTTGPSGQTTKVDKK